MWKIIILVSICICNFVAHWTTTFYDLLHSLDLCTAFYRIFSRPSVSKNQHLRIYETPEDDKPYRAFFLHVFDREVSDGVLNTFVFVAVILWNVSDFHEQCGYLKSISLILSAPRDFLIHNIASIGIWPARSSGQQEMHRTDIIRMRAFLSLLLRSWTLARTLVTNLVLEHHWFLRCSLILPFHSKRFIWSKYWSIINSSIITRELWF